MSSKIPQAAKLLLQGELVAIPTETVYGLAGNALSDHAVARIYEAKGRPSFNPLIVHVASTDQAQEYASANEKAKRLMQHFWPGPLTLVLLRKKDCALSLLASAGLDSVAMRMPSHPLARDLLHECGFPLAAPSANRSGKISPTSAAHVAQELQDKVAMILDGGDCVIGIESTVVDATGKQPVILRPGFITRETLESFLQQPVLVAGAGEGEYKSPGMLQSHYAPEKSLRLNATSIAAGEALLAFGKPLAGATHMENLSPGSDLVEAAANLFRMLRRLDASDATSIAAMPIPHDGLGAAINDRLLRASSR